MDFKEKINDLAGRITELKKSISTEEATKTSMVMPFFQTLGYDVFDPREFVPEFTADVGIKKGEKVDYAIIVDGKPLILVECKSCNTSLGKHGSQLFRYFGTTDAKFGILTNGMIYQFYTDLDNSNKMDSKPFLTIDITNLKDRDITEISKFTKEHINVDSIMNSAENLKYSRLIQDWLAREIEAPSIEFVKLILKNIYEGNKSQKVVEDFTPLIKRAMQQYINDSMNTKIQIALTKEQEQDDAEGKEDTPVKESKIYTTLEELESYAIIKSILRTVVESDRVAYRDAESYFGILLDNNNRKWICRLFLSGTKKYIAIADEKKNPVRHDISTIDDLYDLSDEIVSACKFYLT